MLGGGAPGQLRKHGEIAVADGKGRAGEISGDQGVERGYVLRIAAALAGDVITERDELLDPCLRS